MSEHKTTAEALAEVRRARHELIYHLLRTFNRVALPPLRWLTAVLRKYNERGE